MHDVGAMPVSPEGDRELAAVDPLDVCDSTLDELWFLEANSDQLVGADALVDQEVRVRVDLGRVDSEVPEQGGGSR